jgi:hypothetical protein
MTYRPRIPWSVIWAVVVLALLALLLSACGSPEPVNRKGSAQSQAAGVEAAATTAGQDARVADVTATKAEAVADGARQSEAEATRQAEAQPTAARIEAAAAARVARIQAEQHAREARAVAAALSRQAADLDRQAQEAATRAEAERVAAEAAAAEAVLVSRFQWLGGLGMFASVLVGGGLALSYAPRLGLGLGVAGVAASLALAAFGSLLPYLGAIVLVIVVLGAGAWVLASRRTGAAVVGLSRALDVAEDEPHPDALKVAVQAKEDLGKAMALAPAGLRRTLDRLRGADRRWGRA